MQEHFYDLKKGSRMNQKNWDFVNLGWNFLNKRRRKKYFLLRQSLMPAKHWCQKKCKRFSIYFSFLCILHVDQFTSWVEILWMSESFEKALETECKRCSIESKDDELMKQEVSQTSLYCRFQLHWSGHQEIENARNSLSFSSCRCDNSSWLVTG